MSQNSPGAKVARRAFVLHGRVLSSRILASLTYTGIVTASEPVLRRHIEIEWVARCEVHHPVAIRDIAALYQAVLRARDATSCTMNGRRCT